MPQRKLAATLTGSLRTDIIVVVCLMMACGAIVTLLALNRSVTETLTTYVHERGDLLADVLAEQLSTPLALGEAATVEFLVTTESEHCDYVYLESPKLSLFATRGQMRETPPVVAAHGHDGPFTRLGLHGIDVLDIAAPLQSGPGIVHVGVSLEPVDAARESVVRTVVESTLAVLLGAILTVFFLAGLITRPLSVLADAATRMGRGEGTFAAPTVGHAELRALATTFNEMAAQIRERMRQSEALRAYNGQVLDDLPVGVLVFDPTGGLKSVNQRAAGTEEQVTAALWRDGARVSPIPRSLRLVDGRHFDVTTSALETAHLGPVVVVALADVTEIHTLSDRLHRVERLAVAGEISAGIVHAVNNPLDGMRRAMELARRDLGNTKRVSDMLDLALEGADRIAKITRTLLDLARADAPAEPRAVEAEALVAEALALVSLRAEARGVHLHREVDPGLGVVNIDPRSFTEVLVNLLVNALDAVNRGGHVTIGVRRRDDRGVEFYVADDGPGIDPQHVDHVFEPFFTTKEAGRGTGLGLSVARRIVCAHGGDLFLDPTPGVGSRFVARLPGPPTPPVAPAAAVGG